MLTTTKPAKCPHCRKRLEAIGQKIHDECLSPWFEAFRAKQAIKTIKTQKAKDRIKREKLKTNGQRKAEAQAALNRWIVHGRDVDKPCISCERFHDGVYHAGHYRSRGSAPHLSLDPRNLHKQCAPCNLYLHGNLIGYRAGLISRYGLNFVELLESDQDPRHFTADDYEAIRTEARRKLKEHLK